MPNILKKFSQYLKSVKALSQSSIASYCDDLLIFFQFLKFHFNLEIAIDKINVFILKNVGEKDIYAFFIYLNYYRDNTAVTRGRKLASIKCFYKFLYLYYPSFRGKLNPSENIKAPQKVIRYPKYLNLAQAKKIQEVFTIENSQNPIRNNCIISLFLNSGIRIAELINLSISDINFNSKEAYIIAKGNVERTIFLNDYVISKLKEYLETRKDDCNALFISQVNKRLSPNAVRNICKKAFELIGIKDTSKYSAHTLRHTSATAFYKNTKDILLTKEFLGHRTLLSTEIYTHIEDEMIREAVERNPLSNFGVK